MSSKARKAAFLGISCGLMLVLSAADSIISAAFPLPGVRIGLSNVAIITVMLLYGLPWGGCMALLRTAFAFLARGFTAGLMSLSGGLLSFFAAYILLCLLKRSYKFSALISAVFHTAGQLAAACILTKSVYSLYYAPVLIPASIAAGILTGTVTEMIVKRFGKDMLYRKD